MLKLTPGGRFRKRIVKYAKPRPPPICRTVDYRQLAAGQAVGQPFLQQQARAAYKNVQIIMRRLTFRDLTSVQASAGAFSTLPKPVARLARKSTRTLPVAEMCSRKSWHAASTSRRLHRLSNSQCSLCERGHGTRRVYPGFQHLTIND